MIADVKWVLNHAVYLTLVRWCVAGSVLLTARFW